MVNCNCDPKGNPKRFCLLWGVCALIATIIVFLSIFLNPISSKNSTPQDDTLFIMNGQYDTFNSNITHTFTLHTSQNPNTYGVMVYSENEGFISYNISLKYKLPNATSNTECGTTSVFDGYASQFQCNILPNYFPDDTVFTLTSQCTKHTQRDSCEAYTSVAFLSVNPLSASTKYTIQATIDQYPLSADSRYHYFTIDTSTIYSFKLSLKDEDPYEWNDCESMMVYERCIYVAPNRNNVSFVTAETAMYKSCNYTCQSDGDDVGSYHLETLSVDVDPRYDEYLVSIYLNGGSINSNDLDLTWSDPKLFMEEDSWWYVLIAASSAIVAGLCCMTPACWCWWRGVGKEKWERRKMEKKKKKFLKEWRLFYVNRYNLLMKIFGEKGVVGLIQSYMDDLEMIHDLRDDRTFAVYYFQRYNYEQAFDIGLETPLLDGNIGNIQQPQ